MDINFTMRYCKYVIISRNTKPLQQFKQQTDRVTGNKKILLP